MVVPVRRIAEERIASDASRNRRTGVETGIVIFGVVIRETVLHLSVRVVHSTPAVIRLGHGEDTVGNHRGYGIRYLNCSVVRILGLAVIERTMVDEDRSARSIYLNRSR